MSYMPGKPRKKTKAGLSGNITKIEKHKQAESLALALKKEHPDWSSSKIRAKVIETFYNPRGVITKKKK
jgi:hypothetical protein